MVMVMVQMGATDLASEAHMEKKFWHFVIHPHKTGLSTFRDTHQKTSGTHGTVLYDSPTLLFKGQYGYSSANYLTLLGTVDLRDPLNLMFRSMDPWILKASSLFEATTSA